MTPAPASEARPREIHPLAKELVDSSGFLLTRLGFAFKAKALAALEHAGCDPYDYSVLAILGEGTRETQATIADALGVDPSRLVGLLDSLEQRELIERHRDPQDRRRHAVRITNIGKRQLSRLRAIVRQLENEFLAPLGEERSAFHDLLLQLASHHDPHCAFGSAPSALG